jgi:hypothetical protein
MVVLKTVQKKMKGRRIKHPIKKGMTFKPSKNNFLKAVVSYKDR